MEVSAGDMPPKDGSYCTSPSWKKAKHAAIRMLTLEHTGVRYRKSTMVCNIQITLFGNVWLLFFAGMNS